MQILKADTLVKIVLGPALDIADGITPINSLTLSAADNAELIKHDSATTTDISANTFSAITGADGYYNLTLSASQLDTEGMLTIAVNDTSLCYPIKHEFMVVNANVYDSLYSAAATDYLQVDITQVSANTTAADNLQLQYDGTGLTGSTYPSTQEQVGNISIGAAAISVSAESQVLTTYGTSTGDYTNTEQLDGVYHTITDNAGALDMYYQFDVTGNGVAVTVNMTGRLMGSNDTIGVYAYDWTTSGWGQIGSLVGTNSTTDGNVIFNLLAKYTGTGVNLGKVRVRGYAASGLTSATLYMDQAYVTYSVISQSTGYANGAVWINTVSGQSGTVSFVNGTADNPVDTISDAVTIASNLNLTQFEISNNSTITFAATHNSQVFVGHGYILNLGGQNLDDCYILGATDVNGVATITSNEIHWDECEIVNCTLAQSHFKRCGFGGTVILSSAANYTFQHCFSQIAGGGAPIFDFGASVSSTELNFREYSGGVEIHNMGVLSSDTMSLEGQGQLIIDSSCVGGSIVIRGMFKVTDNSGGAVTITYDDNSTNITTLASDIANGGRTDLLIDSIISLLDDARTEPGQGALPVNPDAMTKIDYIYKFLRNKITSNSTTINVYDSSGSVVDHKSSHSDDTVTYTRGDFVSGP